MKAAVYTSYGPPEVVRVVDVPTPVAKDDEQAPKLKQNAHPSPAHGRR